MKLLIVSHLEHYRRDGRDVCAWPASAREIDVLADEFGAVRHIAFQSKREAPPSAVPYRSRHVTLVPVALAGGKRSIDKARAAAAMLGWVRVIAREMQATDAVHIRTPSSIALAALATFTALPGRSPAWIKYAGEWQGREREPWSFLLQRAWLRSGLAPAAVTVNGEIGGEPAHVFSMPNPSYDCGAWNRAGRATESKQFSTPLRLAFAGRLVPDKGPLFAIRVCEALQRAGVETVLELAGDGPQRSELEDYVSRRGLETCVRFRGWLPGTSLEDLWREAHFAVLPTRTEGWPKALSEAMAYRAVPIASPVGAIPCTLSNAECGLVLRVDDPECWASEILRLATSPLAWRVMADRAQQASADFTYESYIERLRGILGGRMLKEAPA